MSQGHASWINDDRASKSRFWSHKKQRQIAAQKKKSFGGTPGIKIPTPFDDCPPTPVQIRGTYKVRNFFWETATKLLLDFESPAKTESLREEANVGYWIEQLKSHVRALCSARPPAEAIEDLERAWQQTDELVALIESRMRIAVRQAATRIETQPPLWYPDAVSSIQADTLPVARVCAEKLVSSLCARVPTLSPESFRFEAGPNGAVEVRIEGKVTWIVSAPRLPFPGISVRAYFPVGNDASQVEASSFYFASSLLKRTAAVLA